MLTNTEDLSHNMCDGFGLTDRGQLAEPHAVGIQARQRVSQFERGSSLADTTDTDDGHQAMGRHQPAQRDDVGVSSHAGLPELWQVARCRPLRPQIREL